MEYTGSKTKEISFPLGGIGSGCIGLCGNGRLSDFEIFNRPNKGVNNGYSHIAVKAETCEGRFLDARVLNGDILKDHSGQYTSKWGGYGFGINRETLCGLPHFSDWRFKGEFPIAEVTFNEDRFPGTAKLTAFNPFIPLNENDSSIPGAFFEVEIENTGDSDLIYSICFSVRNPFNISKNTYSADKGMHRISMVNSGAGKDSVEYGDLCLACTDGGNISYQEYWYRGGWQDEIETFWRNFTECPQLPKRDYSEPGKLDTCSVCIRKEAKKGEKVRAVFVLTWNIPNNYNYWKPYRKMNADGTEGDHISWKNYYAVMFPDSSASAEYSIKNWNRLKSETEAFRRSMFSSTFPDYVTDAVSSTLAVLKSSSVYRLEDGSLYGFEGTDERAGSCEGTCTHVWNYAYACAFLFPRLERSLRDLDYRYNLEPSGRMQFRMVLPLGRQPYDRRACVDGQMGGVIKTYREWKISGDTEWLRSIWPSVKKSLSYTWSPENEDGWDRNKDGVIEGRQHNTLDMELFGPNPWLEGYYLAALMAATEMALALDERDQAWEYEKLYESGRGWCFDNMFNGEYFVQKIDLSDKSILEKFDCVDKYWNYETNEMRYQMADGCDIDQLCAQWHSNICGLGEILNKKRTKKACAAMYKYNFKKSMRDVNNTWRVYAVNDEAGAIMCDYPKGVKKPMIPAPYNQECMHGFEYQLGGLLISEGFIDEGMEIVKSVRDRYDGEKRNPWNEIECGSNYARSMAAYALVPILSGMVFDMPRGVIGFDPVINKSDFRSIFSLDSAWGNVEIKDSIFTLTIESGSLKIRELRLPGSFTGKIDVTVDGKAVTDWVSKTNDILFNTEICITAGLEVILRS